MIIEFKGKVLDTKNYFPLTDEQCTEIKKEYYKKPDKKDVINNFKNIHKGGVKTTDINNYFVKDLMSKVKLYHSKWSIEEVFECNDLIRFFYAKTLENEKIFPKTDSDIKKIETAIRLGGKGVASKPSNFPMKTVDYILQNYNINNKYYDFSCGWGIRLLSSMKNNIEYYGTDPNYLLTERLNKMGLAYNRVNNVDIKFDIRTHGSEIFVPEWEDTIGLAFSSPPYFALEDYKIGEQSYKDGITYEEWIGGFLMQTLLNIKKYVVKDGYICININDYDKFSLFEDTKKLCIEIGLHYVETLKLDNIKRTKSTSGFNDNSEGILVFKNIK